MMPKLDPFAVGRRSFLHQSAYGLGGIALAMLGREGQAAASAGLAKPADWRGAVQQPHFPVKAKRVIFLCMAGGPSQLETFDWKPALKALDGKPFPESFTKGQQLAQLQNASSRTSPLRPTGCA